MQKKPNDILSDVLFIFPGYSFTYNVLSDSELNVLPPYKGKGYVILRILREIHFRLNLPLKKIWFHKINKEYMSFFIFDPLIIPEYIDWLYSLYPHSKFIMFYNNKCKESNSPMKFHRSFLKLWSSDVNDSLLYNLNLSSNAGFYVRSWKVCKIEPEFDVFFVGCDKGNKRLSDLINLESKFNALGLRSYFHIVPEHRYGLYSNKRYKRPLQYSEVLNFLGKTKAILYLGYGSQECATIRVQESLVHEIKLITDCAWLKKYDFYHPNNIFILGEDKIESLPEFLNNPYIRVESSMLKNIFFTNLAEQIVLNS